MSAFTGLPEARCEGCDRLVPHECLPLRIIELEVEVARLRQREDVYERAIRWRNGYDTGSSSETIWSVMMGVPTKRPSYPLDVSDFGRCYRLLEYMPEWKPRIAEMACYDEKWMGLVKAWASITSAYEREKSFDACPDTYDLIKRALGERR